VTGIRLLAVACDSIRGFEAELNRSRAEARRLRDALSAVHSSGGWAFLQRYYRLRNALLPESAMAAHLDEFYALERRTSTESTSEVGGAEVSVRWGGGSDQIDPITQITREHVRVTYTKRGGAGVRTVTDVVPNRFWTATELTAAIRLAGGFAVAARYGDFDADTAVEAPDAWRMILVLRREDREDRETPEDPAPPTATTTPARISTTPTS